MVHDGNRNQVFIRAAAFTLASVILDCCRDVMAGLVSDTNLDPHPCANLLCENDDSVRRVLKAAQYS
jgi:hypothetical protein